LSTSVSQEKKEIGFFPYEYQTNTASQTSVQEIDILIPNFENDIFNPLFLVSKR